MTSTETRIKITTLATSIIFIILFISSFVIIQVVSVPTPRKRAGAVQQEGALCLWEKPCRERHGWGWSLFLFVSRSKQKGRKINKSELKKNGISTSVISVTWAPYILDFLIFVTKCAVQKISSWQPSCPWFFFRQYSTTWVLIWPGVGRETLLVQRWSFVPSSCFCLGALKFCCNQISYFFCLISIISCYLGEAWRGATWQQNCTNTKGSLFICSIYCVCENT